MTVEVQVHEALRRRGETVAVAESLTGGLIAAALTETPGASETFRGGLVVYATDLKASLAGVPADLLARHGPVHSTVALALARGACRRCGADWGIGVTGVAGPDPQGGQLVGTAWVAVAQGDGTEKTVLGQFDGVRADVRAGAVRLALVVLADLLSRAEDGG